MRKPLTASFLGTSSGGGPTDKRGCSSLVLDLSGGEELWVVDMGEGTTRQFYHQQLGLKPGKVRKIFITHLHLDHCIGVPSFLARFLRGQLQAEPELDSMQSPKIELYGPAGLRTLIRAILTMTSTVLGEPYAIHELLTPKCSPTSCEKGQLHGGEVKGRDILCNEDGLWKGILQSRFGDVDAGPIEHRTPCLGYVFTTCYNTSRHRKVVVLGDTCDPSAIAPLALDADLLVHEATDAAIPNTVDLKTRVGKRTPAFVEAQSKQRGHSTPTMAGEFAKSIRAKRLILNHIGARFPPADYPGNRNTLVIREIERQAMAVSGLSADAVQVAYDFLHVHIGDDHISDREESYICSHPRQRGDEDDSSRSEPQRHHKRSRR